jgi:hypothetical protein
MSATKTTKTTRRIDWNPAPRGVVSATAQATMGLVALGGAGDIAHINPVFAGLGAGVGALSHLLVCTHEGKYSPGAVMYRLACWAGVGTWATWALSGPNHWWNPTGLAALAIAATGAAITAPIGRHRKTVPAAGGSTGAPGTALVRSAGPLGLEWEARFKRVCGVKVQVTEIIRWANGAGYDVVGVLPPGPATRDRIAAACEALATDARLPDGCGCEPKPPRPGSHRGEIVIAVSTVNRFGTRGDDNPPKVPYPRDYSPRSILDPIGQGEHRDGTVATVRLREDSKLIVGRKGGGKTNELDVDTLGVARCRDALVWHIDLNGGGMSQFWLAPWLAGQTERSAIDWAASTPEEALFMVVIASAIAKGRKRVYREFKAAANAKLLPVSAGLPEIVLMMDEGAEALSPGNNELITRQVRDKLAEGQRIGRNEAVNYIISSLRPTAGMLHPDLLNQSAIRVATYGLSAADLGHLYDWKRGISMDDLPVKGTAFLGVMPDTPRPKKTWFLEPDQIKEAAIQIAGYRPDLDEASAEIANAQYAFNLGGRKPEVLSNLYATRYERMRAAFTGQRQEEQEEPFSPAPATAGPARSTTATMERPAPLRLISGGRAASAKDWPDPFEAAPAATTTATISAKDWPDPLPGRTLTAAAPAGQLTAPQPANAARPVPALIRRVLEIFDEAGDDRMHSETLAAELGLTPSRLAELLQPVEVRSLRNPIERGGKKARGYAREDFAQAAERIARGELEVPHELAAWTP